MNFNDLIASPITLMVMMFAIFYFILWRPQQQRNKQLRQMIDNLRRGDVVVMAGGMIGKVVKASNADDPEIMIEIADNVQVKVIKATLTEVRAKTQPVES